ncbi:hypothetical protein [Coraliomargarita sinensis]|uniref:hypothetical protein n=1 Tax=Coraliomargarita sinensis TaxID=2174842 RepID=UPI001304E671|nr:hypothetical protein [Coraliomargarita sinensis]
MKQSRGSSTENLLEKLVFIIERTDFLQTSVKSLFQHLQYFRPESLAGLLQG